MVYNIDQTTASDLTNAVTDYEVSALATDGMTEQDETEWQSKRWNDYWGYFNQVADLKAAMLMKATWNVGKGYTTDPDTEVILGHIVGWGKDTFDDILFNMEVIRRVNGDAFAEIIRDEDTGILINLKPLDPSSMKIIVGKNGMIKRYEQVSKIPNSKEKKTFKPEQIFHLSHNRLADQIHGISDIESMESMILAEGESFADIKKIMHRQARPLIMFKLGTDDQTAITKFVQKMDEATNKGENIYIPDDQNAVNWEVVQVNPSALVMQWREDIKNKFYRAMGLPQIVFGSAGTTESGGKIEYLAHEQVFEKDQRYLEKQIWNQLLLRINLIPPVSLLENLQTDQAKDNTQGLEIQQNDVTAGSGE